MRIFHLFAVTACLGLNLPWAQAQYEGNIWYFGEGAGIDFNNTTPESLRDGQLYTEEGCATICNKQGTLLFYTDGITVFNRQHTPMPNGYNLMGDPSSTQSGIIVPYPDSSQLFYVFTVTEHGKPNGLRYSLVDMRLDSGRGDVIADKKNILVMTPTSERIAAVRHGDRKSYWLATREINGNTFYAWRITSAGISSTAVTSSVGSVHDGAEDGMVGYLKFSQSGQKAAYANRDKIKGLVEVFDFDNETGKFSNPVTLPLPSAYGLEFAPNEKYLYATQIELHSLVQYDISLNNETLIQNSRKAIKIGQTDPAGLQLGPDEKIYITQREVPFLHVIRLPDNEAASCGFQKEAVPLEKGYGMLGLPCIMSDIFTPSDMNFRFTCHGDLTEIYLGTGHKNYLDFGDQKDTTFRDFSGTRITHRYKLPGTYTVTLIYTRLGIRDTLIGHVTIAPAPTVTIYDTVFLCTGSAVKLKPAFHNADKWNWENGDTSRVLQVTQPGTYTFYVYHGECHATATARVIAPPELNLELGPDTDICPGKSITLRAGKSHEAKYLWSTGSQKSVIEVKDSGLYTVVKKDSCNTLRDTVHIGFADCSCPVFIPDIFTPDMNEVNDTWKPMMACDAVEYDLTVFNRFGERIFHTTDQSAAWDGTFKGTLVQDDLYVYLFKAKTQYGFNVYRSGRVIVAR
jgi:gliding motility-associated-like protein